MEKSERNKNKNSYFKQGLTAFLVIAAVILLYFILVNLPHITAFMGKCFSALQPIIFGMVIAYLVNPIYNYVYAFLIKISKNKESRKVKKLLNAVSIFVSLLIFVLLIAAFMYMIIPSFVSTISQLTTILPPQIDALVKWINSTLRDNDQISGAVTYIYDVVSKWLQDIVKNNVNSWAESFATGVFSVVNFVKDFVIGLMVAIYVLASKRTFIAQFKKIMYALFSENKVSIVFKTLAKSHKIFSGFISGKIVDSIIVGIICFVGCVVLGMPYAVLISVIVGVTNVIPVFGPYIGAVPSVLLVLLYDPIKALILTVFIILLQTLDGNVIGPKILGDSTGMSAFWVMFSILIGGGLFGVIGMLLGVPTFAVIFYIIKSGIAYLLKRKNLPEDTMAYYGRVDIHTSNNSEEGVIGDAQKVIDDAE